MSTEISETMIQFGSLDKRHFAKSGAAGQWEQFTVKLPVTFSKMNTLPSVIVTPSDQGLSGFTASQMVPAVGIAFDVTTTGFTLSARNPSNRDGFAGFNWMAALETPGTKQKSVDLRMGVTQPKYFQTPSAPITSIGSHSGHRDWYIQYPSFHHKETAFVTATNLYGTGNRNAAVVGMAIDPHYSGLWIIGENTDISNGDCAFYFVSLAEGEEPVGKDIWVETGGTISMELGPSDQNSSWRTEEVTFRDPFMTPPVVLVTTSSPGWAKYRSVSALGIARYVTTHGFTLAAHNTDQTRGLAWFSWIAIGCDRFCAWGNASKR
jgi:hypothetical protein